MTLDVIQAILNPILKNRVKCLVSLEWHSCYQPKNLATFLTVVTGIIVDQHISYTMKKAIREMQTLRTDCSEAEPKIFGPPQTPSPGVQDSQNLIGWRWSLPLPTNRVWWGSMDAISSYCGNRPTNTQTNPQTHRQDRLQYTAPLSLARSVTISFSALIWLGNRNGIGPAKLCSNYSRRFSCGSPP